MSKKEEKEAMALIKYMADYYIVELNPKIRTINNEQI